MPDTDTSDDFDLDDIPGDWGPVGLTPPEADAIFPEPPSGYFAEDGP